MKNAPSIFVPIVSVGAPDIVTGALPSLNSLVFSASAATADTFVNNEIRPSLEVGASYQVAISLFGYDFANEGWTVGKSSAGSGVVVLSSANEVLKVTVPNANWPSGSFGTPMAAVWLKKNSGNFQLCELMYIDPSNDTEHYIGAEAFATTPVRTLAFIQNASSDSTVGSRIPYGNTYTQLGPTTGGVTYDRSVSTVSVSPDNAPDYNVVTSRGCNLTFTTLPNDLIDVVQATSGIYIKATSGAAVVENTQQTLLTAAAILKGNRFVNVDETNASGTPVKRILVGNLTISQSAVTLNRTKTAVAPVQYNLQTAAIDTLTVGLDTEVAVSRRAL
jgi:hypothetical protein